MAHTAYLALGSNLDDRLCNLRTSAAALAPQVTVRRASPVYETAPWGVLDQPDFLNQVLEVETELSPVDLLAHIKNIEAILGRAQTVRYGPRRIDLDILFYEERVIDLPFLQVPHPRLQERSFVLTPLADVAPDLRHPQTGKTVREMLAELDVSGVERFWPVSPLQFPLDWGAQTYIMGVLNITPDSFSGDGLITAPDCGMENALEQAHAFIAAGAAILDVGGESTRPGSQPVSAAEEMKRVLPVIRAIVSAGLKALISVDTYKAEVAEAALQAGAHWVNDVWALRADAQMADVIARYGCPVVLMHNRIQPGSAELRERLGGRYVGIEYQDLIADIKTELQASIALALAAGVRKDRIIIDPGIGFGKTVQQSLELLDRLGEIRALGYPVLLGVSRKSFIGYTLDLPPAQRVEGTAAAVAVGIVRGADIIRVHDVAQMARVARMTDAIVRRK
ncbi:MAG TPA: dihydropteroate synthase [Levilinea sp.]|nr:dihydropteroate synthase [Levilinea sp.]